jgi:hypothetical protein
MAIAGMPVKVERMREWYPIDINDEMRHTVDTALAAEPAVGLTHPCRQQSHAEGRYAGAQPGDVRPERTGGLEAQ